MNVSVCISRSRCTLRQNPGADESGKKPLGPRSIWSTIGDTSTTAKNESHPAPRGCCRSFWDGLLSYPLFRRSPATVFFLPRPTAREFKSVTTLRRFRTTTVIRSHDQSYHKHAELDEQDAVKSRSSMYQSPEQCA